MTPLMLAAPMAIFRSHYAGYRDYVGRSIMNGGELPFPLRAIRIKS